MSDSFPPTLVSFRDFLFDATQLEPKCRVQDGGFSARPLDPTQTHLKCCDVWSRLRSGLIRPYFVSGPKVLMGTCAN